MSIEIHAREDWTANHITLHVLAVGTATTGAHIYVDLSPEQAERLASQLLEQVKRFRELDKALEKDLGPKFAPGTRVQHRYDVHLVGTVEEGATSEGRIPVLWGKVQGVSWHKPENLQEVSPNFTPKRLRVRLKMNPGVKGTIVEGDQSNPLAVDIDGGGTLYVDGQELQVIE